MIDWRAWWSWARFWARAVQRNGWACTFGADERPTFDISDDEDFWLVKETIHHMVVHQRVRPLLFLPEGVSVAVLVNERGDPEGVQWSIGI